MKNQQNFGVVVAVHPTTKGFGWVVFENADTPVDWGIASAKPGRDARLIKRCDRLLKKYEPIAIVLETSESGSTGRADRVRKLCREFAEKAGTRGVVFVEYRRSLVARTLGLEERATRHDIAIAVSARAEAFSHRLPPRRKPWVAQDPRQSLFDAAALAMTFFDQAFA